MSSGELKRLGVLARVEKEALKLVNAAEILGLSYRQRKRIWRRYQEEGAEGLQHRGVGRGSGRAKSKKFRRKVLRLVRQKYSGEVGERFGPTLAAEHLESEDGIQVHAETLRRWMLAEGLWSRMRKRRAHRKRREPRKHFGELVQMDGSFHEWFEQGGPKGCLMNLVDDATATTLTAIGALGNDLDGGGSAAGMDRAIRGTGGVVHGLENGVCQRGDRAATPARRGIRDAVRADVPAAGDSNHRGQFCSGERPGGAQSWHSSGPAGEEIAAQEHPEL